MKHENTVCRSHEVSLEASQLCCLARVNALLKSLRIRHDRAADVRRAAQEHRIEAGDDPLYAPTPHDLCVAELEASVTPEAWVRSAIAEDSVDYDNPREIARARLVFAATMVVPLLMITTGLALFDGELGRASMSLLQFSALALATPLVLALASTLLNGSWQGMRRRQMLALVGVTATAGYATSAFAMTETGAGTSGLLALSTAGVLVLSIQFWQWLNARKSR